MPSPKRICLICGAPTIYAHSGIDACRACSEFYRRTVTSSKTYSCRQGKGQCKINKSESSFCRRCRYEKCKLYRMLLEDPRKKKSEKETSPFNELEPPNSFELPSIIGTDSILSRLAREYTLSTDRRKYTEKSARAISLRQHVKVQHASEDLLLCSWTFLMTSLRLFAGDYFSFASACFSEFEALTLDDKRLILQSSAARMYILETHYLTAKVFRTGEGPFYMMTLTTCLNRENIEFLVHDVSTSVHHEEFAKSMTYYTDCLQRIIWPAMVKTALTDTEFHALFGLVIWQIDPSQSLPERIMEIAAKIRQAIFADLRRYYQTELQLDNYSVRMGNLMSLEHAIQEANSLKGEEMQMYNLLDMLHDHSSFLQGVLQIKL